MISAFGAWAMTLETAAPDGTAMGLARFWKRRLGMLPLARRAGQRPTARAAAVLALFATLTLAAPTLTLSRAPAEPPQPNAPSPAVSANSATSDPLDEVKIEPLPAALAPNQLKSQAPVGKLEPIGLAEVTVAPLTAEATLEIRPELSARVRAPIGGEIVAIGQTRASDAKPGEQAATRDLRPGDRVSKGELLVVVASQEFGEMKSHLADALLQKYLDELLLDQLKEPVAKDADPEGGIVETEKTIELDKAAVEKAERRLRSCGAADEEIKAIRLELLEKKLDQIKHEAAKIQAESDIEIRYAKMAFGVARFTYLRNKEAASKLKNAVPTELKKLELEAERARLRLERAIRSGQRSSFEAAAKKAGKEARLGENWNRLEIRSPSAGMIINKKAALANVIDPQSDLFTVADLTTLLVRADVSEKLVSLFEAIPSDQRNWTVFGEVAHGREVVGAGRIESIGKAASPSERTLTGSLNNPGDAFRPGLVAQVVVPHLPAEGRLRAIPQAALVPGDTSRAEWKVWVKSKAAEGKPEVQIVARVARTGPWAICRPANDRLADPVPVGSKVIVWREQERNVRP